MNPFYETFFLFTIYAFIGWCGEVVFAAVRSGKFVNRGFLNGPVCPIYGFGAVIVIRLLTPLQKHLPFLFIGSVFLTSVLEFITGFLLEKIFHTKWWDYSKVPLNLCGYVCFKFSFAWGVACILLMRVLHPFIAKAVSRIPAASRPILLVLLLCAFAADISVTVASILKLRKRLRLMEGIAAKLKQLSDRIGDNLFSSVSHVKETSQHMKENTEEWKRRHKELTEKYKHLAEGQSRIHQRLMNAFPALEKKRRSVAADIKNSDDQKTKDRDKTEKPA